MATFYTIRSADVGKRTILAFGHRWPVEDFIGHIYKHDVGKRVYSMGDFLQVENDEQMRRRLGPTKNPSKRKPATKKRTAAQRSASARKAARTRAKKAEMRSRAAKKAAATRKRNARKSAKSRARR